MVGSECVLESLHIFDLGDPLTEGAHYLLPVFFDGGEALLAEQVVRLADEHRVVLAVVEGEEADFALILEEFLGLPEREC